MIFRNLIFALLFSLTSLSALAGKHFLEFNPNLHEKINGKYAMKNQLLIGMPADTEMHTMQQFNSLLKEKGVTILSSEVISSNTAKVKIVKLKLTGNQPLNSVSTIIQTLPNVEWVQPDYIYNIGVDPREIAAPNDPKVKDQYHHQLMQNFAAWDVATGSNVLVAVTDDGFELNHEDLATRFVSQKAYNFCDNNTNVSPTSDGSGEHGTHVSGIVAAELNNGKGGAGVAGNATVLPVKFYSFRCSWTSSLVYKAYQYAVDNGAKIISTSYNIDGFVKDKTFIAAVDYGYDKGILHFNSAGNNYQKDPARQAFDELILVISTDKEDKKSDFSNYGKRIQISAPGDKILSTIPKNTYDYMSGTSMATPNAAGSAALIWSAHPAWNRDQVAAQLIGTADNIDDKNPNYKGMLGSGRINNKRALTEKLAPAKIREVIVTTTAAGSGKKNVALAIQFDKLLDPHVVNNGVHWEVKSLDNSTIIPVTVKHRWATGSMMLDLALSSIPAGKYELTLKDSLQDPFGQAIDGSGKGVAGGDFTYVFVVT